MSIVDSTLQRLGTPEAKPAAAAQNLSAPPSLDGDLLFVAGPRKARQPLALWLGLVFLAGGAAAYLLLPGAGKAPADIEPLPGSVAVKEVPPVPLPAPAAAPVAPAAAAVRPVSVPETVPLPAVAEMPQEAKLLPAAAVPATTIAAPALPEPEPDLPWLMDGWAAVDAGHLEQACVAWEAGLRGLPNDRRLIVGYAYLDASGLRAAFHRRVPEWATFAFREGRAGQYRIAVLAPLSGASELRAAIGERFGRADLVSAGYLKMRIVSARETPAKPKREASVPKIEVPKPETPGAAAPKLDAEKKVKPEVQRREQGDMPGAPTAAQEASHEAARRWEGRAGGVREQLRLGAYGPAAMAAEALTKDFSERWEPWYWLGTAQLARGQLAAAEQSLDRALKQNARVAQIWIQRAVAAQERSDHQSAVQFLAEALALEPRIPEIYLNMGFSNDALGRSADAEKNFGSFLALTEGNAVYAVQRKHIQDRLSRQ